MKIDIKNIKDPFFDNEENTVITCIHEYSPSDGVTVREMLVVNSEKPIFDKIVKKFKKKVLSDNRIKFEKLEKKTTKNKKKDAAREQEDLFKVKLEIFEIEKIKNSTNRELKSKIRKAKTKEEARSYADQLLNE